MRVPFLFVLCSLTEWYVVQGIGRRWKLAERHLFCASFFMFYGHQHVIRSRLPGWRGQWRGVTSHDLVMCVCVCVLPVLGLPLQQARLLVLSPADHNRTRWVDLLPVAPPPQVLSLRRRLSFSYPT